MSPRAAKPKPPPDPAKLRRTGAGRYVSGDERFTVESSSGGWMVEDAEQTNELGLALVRGPFPTLDAAKAAIEEARTGPAPVSDLAERAATIPKPAPGTSPGPSKRRRVIARHGVASGPAAAAAAGSPAAHAGDDVDTAAAPEPDPEPEAAPPPIEVREYRSGDGDSLRALWTEAGFGTTGDDDRALRTFAQRNPGLFLVATRGDAIVGSAMGGWDGRRGWIYHVAAADDERRAGLATDLVRRIEAGLRDLGCRRVNVIVRDENRLGSTFWLAVGYTRSPARPFAKDLDGD